MIRLAEQTHITKSSQGPKIAVLMSGGVDSSVTAKLLKASGWDVIGVTMRVPMAGQLTGKRPCCGLDAAYVCQKLDITHWIVDVREVFEEFVIKPFREAYLKGHTPNPCADCNTFIKFRLVWDYLEQELGITHLATGHYARVINRDGRFYLARATDTRRDQSYFLYGIPKHRLANLILPLGNMTKDEVRSIARNAGLPVAYKPDSMELCFSAQGDYRMALALPQIKGPVIDEHGDVIGEHRGIWSYTIGQQTRMMLRSTERKYVAQINPADNTIRVAGYKSLLRRRVRASQLNILDNEQPLKGSVLLGKIRSTGELARCTVMSIDDQSITVEFEQAQFAPAPGQKLVLYDFDGRVVCGGTIQID